MQIGTKFSVSIHILLSVEVFKDSHKVTSDFIASSVNTNPVVIRKLMSSLGKAGLIEVAQGTGGICLTRSPDEITLLDVMRAVEPQTKLFKIHQDTAPGCPIGGQIGGLLTPFFLRIQSSFDSELESVCLAEIMDTFTRLNSES